MTLRSAYRLLLAIYLFASFACNAGNETDGAGAGTSTESTTNGPSTDASTTGGFATVDAASSAESSSGTGMLELLTIDPVNPSIDVVWGTPGTTVQFTATDKLGNLVNPDWYVSSPEAGTIDGTGLFTASGVSGGDLTVYARYLNNAGQTNLRINLTIRENPAGLAPADQAVLDAPGGTAEAGFRLVYPYDGTVFPRGIPVPELHPEGTATATAYRVHVGLPGCEYTGYLASDPQLLVSQAAWDALGSCSDGSNAAVEVSKLVKGAKVGPIAATWRIAKGSLHGTIFYNTYDSPESGAIMRIKGNSVVPEVLVGGCVVCHSIAADGSTAAAASAGTLDLSGGMANPPIVWNEYEAAAFAGLYPKNGEVLVTNGSPGNGYPPNIPGLGIVRKSELRMKDGTIIPSSGIEDYFAMSPVFSPDGKYLAFTNRDGAPNAQGVYDSVLGVMDYDHANKKFSNYRALADAGPGRHLSWPAFTPDNKWVIVQEGTGEDLATWSGNTANLRAFHVVTGSYLDLPNLNRNGVPRVGRDEDKNYEPTVLPVAVGGYFWVMFTSRRTFGNRLTGDAWGSGAQGTKRLWVAAFDVTADGTIDPSHAPFYVTGQDISSGNSRGFWALDPCKQMGDSCETGDQCCDGFCNPDPNNPNTFVCGTPDGNCSDEFESCVTAADCCDATLLCIGGKCSEAPPS